MAKCAIHGHELPCPIARCLSSSGGNLDRPLPPCLHAGSHCRTPAEPGQNFCGDHLKTGRLRTLAVTTTAVDHPQHYGGADDPYEAIKVIEAWQLGFNLGNAAKYIRRAGRKGKDQHIEDLEKAAWYLAREIKNRKNELAVAGG